MASLERALAIAVSAHQGYKDKTGLPYILHPLRIMARMEKVDDMIIAVLHDVVEDSDWTLDDLRREGFSGEIIAAVDSLTRREDETYPEYIERVKRNPAAIPIKLGDLEDNMNMLRLKQLGENDWERFRRYHRAYMYLKSEPQADGQ